uniref:C2H2-type domain-containing protein n=1 Tax=Strix occidentalis caurina TaxID=311401 RepID=A0A8D0FDP8_STROC
MALTEQRGMLQGPEEEPQSPTVDVEHDDPQEATTQPWSNSRGKEYKCEHCGKVFTCGSNLNRHRKIHTGEKPFKCHDCGKSFMLNGYLLSHQRTHTREKPYLCTTCGKCFSFSSNLLVHKSIHTRAIRYACSYCGKTFREGYHLRRHQQALHNGESSQGLNPLSHRAHP